jgi:hypothetical protein
VTCKLRRYVKVWILLVSDDQIKFMHYVENNTSCCLLLEYTRILLTIIRKKEKKEKKKCLSNGKL